MEFFLFVLNSKMPAPVGAFILLTLARDES